MPSVDPSGSVGSSGPSTGMDGIPDSSCISGVHRQSSRSNTIIVGSKEHDDAIGTVDALIFDDEGDDVVLAAGVEIVPGPFVPLPILLLSF